MIKTELSPRSFNMLFFSILLLFNLCSCYEKKDKDIRKNTIQKIKLLINQKDLLANIFLTKNFGKSIDTLSIKEEEVPMKISLVEYYGGSSYTVSHLKILLLLFSNKSVVYLFKYRNDIEGWKITKSFSGYRDKLEGWDDKILKVSDWTEKREYDPKHTTGDIIRYQQYLTKQQKLISEIAYSPTNKLITLVGEVFK